MCTLAARYEGVCTAGVMCLYPCPSGFTRCYFFPTCSATRRHGSQFNEGTALQATMDTLLTAQATPALDSDFLDAVKIALDATTFSGNASQRTLAWSSRVRGSGAAAFFRLQSAHASAAALHADACRCLILGLSCSLRRCVRTQRLVIDRASCSICQKYLLVRIGSWATGHWSAHPILRGGPYLCPAHCSICDNNYINRKLSSSCF